MTIISIDRRRGVVEAMSSVRTFGRRNVQSYKEGRTENWEINARRKCQQKTHRNYAVYDAAPISKGVAYFRRFPPYGEIIYAESLYTPPSRTIAPTIFYRNVPFARRRAILISPVGCENVARMGAAITSPGAISSPRSQQRLRPNWW